MCEFIDELKLLLILLSIYFVSWLIVVGLILLVTFPFGLFDISMASGIWFLLVLLFAIWLENDK